jgi:hypothetical protein
MFILFWFICGIIGAILIVRSEFPGEYYGFDEICISIICIMCGYSTLVLGLFFMLMKSIENKRIKIKFKNPFYKGRK